MNEQLKKREEELIRSLNHLHQQSDWAQENREYVLDLAYTAGIRTLLDRLDEVQRMINNTTAFAAIGPVEGE